MSHTEPNLRHMNRRRSIIIKHYGETAVRLNLKESHHQRKTRLVLMAAVLILQTVHLHF